MLSFSEYQSEALSHDRSPALPCVQYLEIGEHSYAAQDVPLYPFIKLAGESGEVLEKIGKSLRDNGGLVDRDALLKELGDVLWYVTKSATALGSSLELVAAMNLAKLAQRESRGTIQGSGDDR